MSLSQMTREYIAAHGDRETGKPPICFVPCANTCGCIGVILGREYKTTLQKCKTCWCWYGNRTEVTA